jgi:hypothetical protein
VIECFAAALHAFPRAEPDHRPFGNDKGICPETARGCDDAFRVAVSKAGLFALELLIGKEADAVGGPLRNEGGGAMPPFPPALALPPAFALPFPLPPKPPLPPCPPCTR